MSTTGNTPLILTANHINASIRLRVASGLGAADQYGTTAKAITHTTEVSWSVAHGTYDTTNQSTAGYKTGGISTHQLTGSFSLIAEAQAAYELASTSPVVAAQERAGFLDLLRFALQQRGQDNQVEIMIAPQAEVGFLTLKFLANLTTEDISAPMYEAYTGSVSFESSGIIEITAPPLVMATA